MWQYISTFMVLEDQSRLLRPVTILHPPFARLHLSDVKSRIRATKASHYFTIPLFLASHLLSPRDLEVFFLVAQSTAATTRLGYYHS